MQRINRKNIEIGVLFGLICAIVLSFARFDARCEELRQGVLRLHIVANSDSEVDQQIKLAIRDKILESTINIFNDCENIDEAVITAGDNIDAISCVANEVLKQNGLEYKANVSVGNKYFNTREYDDFTLPAGTYKSLIVNIGEAKGKNWWCVVFPCVCVPSAMDATLSDSVSQSAADTAQNAPKYEIKFKTVELYEKLKKYFSKN